MSKKDERLESEHVENTKKAYSKGRVDGIIFAAVALSFFIAGCCSALAITHKLNSNESSEQSSNQSSTSATDSVLSRQLVKGKDRDAELENINNIMDNLRSNNIAFIVENSSGYDGYMYNKYGECIQQNSDSSVSTLFTSDGHSVRVNATDGTISLDGSIDILTSCENVLSNASKGTDGYSVYKTEGTKDDDGVTYSSCIVNIKGFDACKTLYENLGDDMAESAIEKLKEMVDSGYSETSESTGSTESSASTTKSFDWTPEFEYVFVYSDNDQFGMQCNCIINGEAQNNWYTDGYQETGEWKLEQDWSSVDWKATDTDSFDAICEKLTKELKSVDSKLNINDEGTSNSSSNSSEKEADAKDSTDATDAKVDESTKKAN